MANETFRLTGGDKVVQERAISKVDKTSSYLAPS